MTTRDKDLCMALVAHYYCTGATGEGSRLKQAELGELLRTLHDVDVDRSQISRWLKQARERGWVEEITRRSLNLPDALQEQVEARLVNGSLQQRLREQAFHPKLCPRLKKLVVVLTPRTARDEDARIPYLASHCAIHLMNSITRDTRGIGWAWGKHCLAVADRLSEVDYGKLECIPLLGTTAIGRGIPFAEHVRDRQASRVCELAARQLRGVGARDDEDRWVRAVPLSVPAFLPRHLVADKDLPVAVKLINGFDEVQQIFGEEPYFSAQGDDDVAELRPGWQPESHTQLKKKGKLSNINAIITSVGALADESPITSYDLLPARQIQSLRKTTHLAGDLAEQVMVLPGQTLSEKTLDKLARLRRRALSLRIRDMISMVANGTEIHVLAARPNRAEAVYAAVHLGAVTHLYIDEAVANRVLELDQMCRTEFGYLQ